MIHFEDIKLGRASAELAGAYDPELIVDGFLDPWDVVERARNGSEFLFLGYKGSGKSAIGEHLRLTAERSYDLFVTHRFLSDFPYGNFAKIVTGDAEPESRFPSAWQWLLTLTLLDSISKDHGVFSDDTERLQRSLEDLKSIGLLPSTDLKKIVVASSRIKYLGELSEHLRREGLLEQTDIPTLLEPLFDCSAIGNLRKDARNNVFWSFRFRNRHSHLKLDEEIVVHRDLWRAMNIY